MSAVNFDTDRLTILSSLDEKVMDYNRAKAVETENNYLTIGVMFLLVTATILTVYVNKFMQEKRKDSNVEFTNYIKI